MALAAYGLGDADSLLPVEHYTTRGQEHERVLMPGYVFVGCVMNADMWQRLRHLRGCCASGEPYEAIPEEQMTAVMALYWHGVQGNAGSPAKRRDRSGRRTAAGSDAYDHLRGREAGRDYGRA